MTPAAKWPKPTVYIENTAYEITEINLFDVQLLDPTQAYAELSRRLDEAVLRRSRFEEAMSADNKWITLMKSVSTAKELSQALIDESVESVRVHQDGAIELTMKYGDIYALTLASIKEVQEAMQ